MTTHDRRDIYAEELEGLSRQTRQKQIENLDPGESIAVARRLDLTFGIDPERISKFKELVKGTMDAQANRARRRTGREFTVESGSFLSRSGGMIMVSVVTRIG